MTTLSTCGGRGQAGRHSCCFTNLGRMTLWSDLKSSPSGTQHGTPKQCWSFIGVEPNGRLEMVRMHSSGGYEIWVSSLSLFFRFPAMK